MMSTGASQQASGLENPIYSVVSPFSNEPLLAILGGILCHQAESSVKGSSERSTSIGLVESS